MQNYVPSPAAPLTISSSVESKTYGLFALAMLLTAVGVWIALATAPLAFSGGMLLALTLIELVIILTSSRWARVDGLNIVLFAAFPLLSGMTVTPYLFYVVEGYSNGAQILLQALGATTCMGLAAAVAAKLTGWNLGFLGKFLIFGLFGLLFLVILQLFVPSMSVGTGEILISGFGMLLFAGFLAYDIQRVAYLARANASAFQLALSLYLDVFNLFLYVLRFMLAISGSRRR